MLVFRRRAVLATRAVASTLCQGITRGQVPRFGAGHSDIRTRSGPGLLAPRRLSP